MPLPFQPTDAPGVGAAPLLPAAPGGRPWRALLADDNALNREVGAALLQQLGLEVQTARDGEEALQQVASGGYDLVLMDVQMPRLDGLSATRRLRALPGLARLPVIALTADVLPANRADCLAAGMDDFVTKPVDVSRLAHTLSRWLAAA